jgi:hypothetical protein
MFVRFDYDLRYWSLNYSNILLKHLLHQNNTPTVTQTLINFTPTHHINQQIVYIFAVHSIHLEG